MSRLFAHWPLGVILVCFASVGLLYSINTPIFEGADEPAHLDYIQSLSDGRGLPIFDLLPSGENVNYEAHQPPLYYAITALATGWIDTSDAATIGRENPHRIFDPLALTNRNLFVHTSAEAPPYQGTALAVHLARLISLLWGAGAVAATYALARSLFPARRELWAGAAAFVAFVPQFDFTSATINNDSAITCLVALALWQLTRIAQRSAQGDALRRRDVALLGILAGLAPLAKESGLAVLPFALLLLMPVLWLRAGWRAALGAGLIISASFVLVSGWWFVVRHAALGFWLVDSGPLALVTQPLTLADVFAQWQEIELSFWGLFGWTIVPMPQAAYDSLHWLSVLGLAGVGAFVALRRGKGRETVMLAALVFWMILVLVAFVRWVSATDQPHGRLLFPALPAFALLVCVGLTQFSLRRLRPALMAALSGALLCISVWSAAVLLPSAYPAPVYVSASAPIPNRIDANLGGQIALLGYAWQVTPHGGRNILAVDVYWQATSEIHTDYSVTVQAFAPDGRRVGQLDTYPVSGMHPTSDWHTGDIVRDEYPLMISPNAAPNLKVMVGMYDLDTGKALQVIRPDGTRVGRITIEDVHWVDLGG